ncbi:hypothetical protein [Candidiatus Paracoxiella cheracis]|uniref:hypothetical protein n=1 Tax=Candidiatus Paracoxiella cheracis TaxID=3405120 RepID=UPI003BF60B6D
MVNQVFQGLEKTLSKQSTKQVKPYLNQITDYLSDASTDEQEQRRRIEKILASRSPETIRKIPDGRIAAFAAKDGSIEKILASRSPETIRKIPDGRIAAFAAKDGGIEKILASRSPEAIRKIPDESIEAFAAKDGGIEKILASHSPETIRKIPDGRIAAFAAEDRGIEKILASHSTEAFRKIPYQILCNYLHNPNIDERKKQQRINKIKKSRLPKATKEQLFKYQPPQPVIEPDSTTDKMHEERRNPQERLMSSSAQSDQNQTVISVRNNPYSLFSTQSVVCPNNTSPSKRSASPNVEEAIPNKRKRYTHQHYPRNVFQKNQHPFHEEEIKYDSTGAMDLRLPRIT